MQNLILTEQDSSHREVRLRESPFGVLRQIGLSSVWENRDCQKFNLRIVPTGAKKSNENGHYSSGLNEEPTHAKHFVFGEFRGWFAV